MNADSHVNKIIQGLYHPVKWAFILSCILLVYTIFPPIHVDTINSSRITKASATTDSLCLALEQYKNDMGQFPATNDSRLVMQELTGYKDSDDTRDIPNTTTSLWNGPYYEARKREFKRGMLNEALIDPWDSPYCFKFSGLKPKIWSWGPNRKNELGMGDDITNWISKRRIYLDDETLQIYIPIFILLIGSASLAVYLRCLLRDKQD